MSKSNQFEIKSELTEVKVMASYFRNFCIINQIDESTSGLLELALVESLNNIIIHAYQRAAGFDIYAEFELLDSQVIITITDFGKEFHNENDGIDTPIREITSKINELPEGSWGLGLIKTISDEIISYRESDSNILKIKKNISI